MTSSIYITSLLWAAALGSGLMAGVYFAFSGFIMSSFKKLPPEHAISAMNSINETILRSLFMPLFFGSSVVSVLMVLVAIINWGNAASGLLLIAGGVYFIGMLLCTVVFNVPLNNALLEVDPVSDDGHQFWSHYLKKWTGWNHLRTVSSLITCAMSIWILVAY